MKTYRNGTIDFMRFVFTVGIVFCHAGAIWPGIPNGWIGVEFFFLVSGWLMCNKAICIEKPVTWNLVKAFIIHKLSGFYPEAILALILGGGIYILSFCTTLRQILSVIAHVMLDSLMLQVIVARFSNPGGVMWYLSAMILGMLAIFPLMVTYKRDFIKYAIIVALLIYLYMWHTWNTVSPVYEPIAFHIGHIGLLRGIADMLLGCVSWFLTDWMRSRKVLSKGFLTVLELLGYGIVLYLGHTGLLGSGLDFLCIALLMMAVTISFSEMSMIYGCFQNRLVKWLGGYSLNLYLSHITLATLFVAIVRDGKFDIQPIYMAIVFFILSNLLALLNRFLSTKVRRLVYKDN